jgi:hypothetical protein
MTEQAKHEPNHHRRLLKKLVFIGMDTILTMLAFWLADSFIVTISTHRISLRFPVRRRRSALDVAGSGGLVHSHIHRVRLLSPAMALASIPNT